MEPNFRPVCDLAIGPETYNAKLCPTWLKQTPQCVLMSFSASAQKITNDDVLKKKKDA